MMNSAAAVRPEPSLMWTISLTLAHTLSILFSSKLALCVENMHLFLDSVIKTGIPECKFFTLPITLTYVECPHAVCSLYEPARDTTHLRSGWSVSNQFASHVQNGRIMILIASALSSSSSLSLFCSHTLPCN